MASSNILKCKYCDWRTGRFRGKRTYNHCGMTYGEVQLRMHVQECHPNDYFAAQGLVPHPDAEKRYDTVWNYDTDAPLGEQAL